MDAIFLAHRAESIFLALKSAVFQCFVAIGVVLHDCSQKCQIKQKHMLHREPETETERERTRESWRERDPARESEREIHREPEILSGSL